MIGNWLATAKITKRRGLRNLTLRICPRYGHLKLTVPWRTSQKAVQAFVSEHADWIKTQQAKSHPTLEISQGCTMLWQGQDYVVQHHATPRGVEILPHDATKILHVHCPAPRILRSLQRFYQQQALLQFSELAYAKFTALSHLYVVPAKAGIANKLLARDRVPSTGRRDNFLTAIQKISVRDTTSRWGSCSRDGKLSFSWRLIMAPDFVQDYVVAHEVAHLAHFNHSDEFWACCQSLSCDMSAAKIWIRRHGPLLQRAWIITDTES